VVGRHVPLQHVASAVRVPHLQAQLGQVDLEPTTTIIDRRDNTHGDYLWDEATNTLYVASVAMPNTTSPFAVPATPDDVRIFRYTYDSGTDTYTQIGGSLSYRAILGTGSTASPAFRGGAWSVTIDKDSTGRLWVVLAQAHEVRYSTSDDNGQTWTTAAQLPTQGSNTINVGAMSDSDIASVIAFGNGSKNTVGVMWSDQDNLPAATNNGYYFSTIAAATIRRSARTGRPTSCPTAASAISTPTTTST
jgi:hypothetical protein